jgi:Cu(I)/Ag(I) efflux system membrane fusion protein
LGFRFQENSPTPKTQKNYNLKPNTQPAPVNFKSKPVLIIVIAIVVLAAFLAGRLLPRGGGARHDHTALQTQDRKPSVFTCPMHPQIRQGEPGRCPICAMELVAAPEDDRADDDGDAPRLRVSARAAALMDIRTWPVERRHVEAERRFLGKFVFDETRLFDIVTRTEGQITRLFVNFTGVSVRKGEHLAEFYSPEFFIATQELLLTRAPAAKTKLRLMGVSDEQIEDILRSGQPRETFTLFSPVTGVLKELDGRQGVWRMKGERLLQLADLSTLWALLDAYESDLPLVHYGQQVQLEVAAFPGRQFTGFVAFIAPELDERTRTVKVRLNVPNPDGALRPGMFARALLQAPLNVEGHAYGPELAGKWICPMHPEIVGDAPAACDICGMPLDPAEKLGYVRAEEKVELPLVIPASAPLITGKRAVVYVKLPDTDRPTFEGREVVLGPRAGEFYIVHRGLAEGEQVVTQGNFKIDSELQLRGLPSMMAPQEGRGQRDGGRGPEPVSVPQEFSEGVAGFAAAYLRLTTTLAKDEMPAVKELEAALTRLDEFKVAEWQPVSRGLHGALHVMEAATDIEVVRRQLPALTAHTEEAITQFAAGKAGVLYRAHCPMAFDNQGADWLQAGKDIANPYFGARMFRCGEIRGEVR